ncbi:hypothetical protein K443DRAFT_92949 [Laccaria amethystina LaAM-08-1]|uniref:Uncharacterized protein n=1 Tax=Laccaria amethystina LaAM-08-1 TaxID=1095629 RepID=A0A0C9Y953_9AGAR|nr:hypothetical protein K443DRAFT_92949 [Laccaria amethystina LaAM-08-1]
MYSQSSHHYSSPSHPIYADTARAHTLSSSLNPGSPQYEEICRRPSYIQNEFGYFVSNEARADMKFHLSTADMLACNTGLADMYHENNLLEQFVDLVPPDVYAKMQLPDPAPASPTKAASKRGRPKKAAGRPRSPTKASTRSPRKAAAAHQLASVAEHAEPSGSAPIVSRGRPVTHDRAEDELRATMSASTAARLRGRAMQNDAMEGVVPSQIYSVAAPPTMSDGSPVKPAIKQRRVGTRTSPRKSNKVDFA